MSLRDVRCFLLDMDGTFYLGEKLLDGSLDFIAALEKSAKQYLFLTNNSSRGAVHYQQKLSRMGLSVPIERILTSGQATAQHLYEKYPGAKVLLLGNDALKQEFAACGVEVVDRGFDVAVIGFDTTLAYYKLCVFCDAVRSGVPYIATHPDYNCPTETGCVPDIGAMMALIHASTGREADVIIGKPHVGIVSAALARVGFTAKQCAMVGDRLYTDIETGIRHGMTSVLVLTGETTLDMLRDSGIKPDLVYNRLSDMIPYLN